MAVPAETKYPEWFSYIRIYVTRVLGTSKPPQYVISFGPRNLCLPDTEKRAEMLQENIRTWLWMWISKDQERRDTKELELRADLAVAHADVHILKSAIRRHRDERGDDRCYLDDRRLYAVLGEGLPDQTLPPRDQFLSNCQRFWECRQGHPDPQHAEIVYRRQSETLGTAQELEMIAEWVRRGDYNRDDARDQIARAIENRAHAIRATVELLSSEGSEGR